MKRWLLLWLSSWAISVWAQIPPIGTSATLEVATWNVEWLGDQNNGPSDEARQQANVRAVIAQSEIDLWALQEVSNAAAFQALLDSLGSDYEGVLGTTLSGGAQRLAFVYRRSVVQRLSTEQILTQFAEAFAYRPPLLLKAKISLADTTVSITFITLHMKAGATLNDYERRREAAQRLKSQLDNLYPRVPVIVLGDWNDELHASIFTGFPSPYENFRMDTTNYRFLTETLDAADMLTWCGHSSTCRTGSTLDHILITNELFAAYEEGSADRFAALLEAIPNFVFSTSDHLPVYARFQFFKTTAVEGPQRPPVALQVYPNPAHHEAVLLWEGQGAPVTIRLWDVLGRLVRQWTQPGDVGPQRFRIALEGLAAGVYRIEVSEGDRQVSRNLIRLP